MSRRHASAQDTGIDSKAAAEDLALTLFPRRDCSRTRHVDVSAADARGGPPRPFQTRPPLTILSSVSRRRCFSVAVLSQTSTVGRQELWQPEPPTSRRGHRSTGLSVTPWDTRSAQPASDSYLYDKRYVKLSPRVRRDRWGPAGLAGAALRSAAAPALAVDRKVGPRPSQYCTFPSYSMSVSAMHA